MNYVDFIKVLDDKTLEEFVKLRIKELENSDNNSVVLGYDVESDFTNMYLDGDTFNIDYHCFYRGYIPKDTKLVFGLSYDINGYIGNDGKYYYLDEDDYIIDFCKFIKDKRISNELELFDYILAFIEDYFGMDDKIIYDDKEIISREKMFQLLYKSDYNFYTPSLEHGISWFKGRGNALCSEYSIIANNIMNFMGINSSLILGCQNNGREKVEGHAYNIASYERRDNGKREYLLIDYADYVCRMNANYEIVGNSPFIGKLDYFDNDYLKNMIFNDKHLVFSDYSLIEFGEHFSCLAYKRKRDYFIDTEIRFLDIEQYNKKMV